MCEDTGLMAIELQEAGYLVVHEDDDYETIMDAFRTIWDWLEKKDEEFLKKYGISLEDD